MLRLSRGRSESIPKPETEDPPIRHITCVSDVYVNSANFWSRCGQPEPPDKRGFKTKRDARAFAEEIEVDKRRGLYVAPSDGRVRFGDLARAWLDSKHNLKRSTRARYQSTTGAVVSRHLRAVSVADLQNFVGADGIEPPTAGV